MTRVPALLLAPLVLAQARTLRRRTPHLEPVTPPEVHRVGERPETVLVVGDSTAVGTGVDALDETVGASFAAALDLDGWTVAGRSGATAGRVLAEFGPLLPASTGTRAVLVLVGWNDVLRLHPAPRFAVELEGLLKVLARRAPAARIALVEPPRFGDYAVIPQPLRLALGAQARGLTRVAREVAAQHGVATVPGLDGRRVARDRFHPDAQGYRELGVRAADALRS
jgi:lysophospholipase L1-like esterase